jgi:multidrug efflux pump subunit AcrB
MSRNPFDRCIDTVTKHNRITLLGSTLTSAGAFATVALVPNPQLVSFGSIVVIALVTAFLVSLLVLPSLLLLWSRYAPNRTTAPAPAGEPATQDCRRLTSSPRQSEAFSLHLRNAVRTTREAGEHGASPGREGTPVTLGCGLPRGAGRRPVSRSAR